MDVIKVKKVQGEFLNKGLADIIDILKASYITIFVFLFSVIYLFENIQKLGSLFSSNGRVFVFAIIVAIMGMFLVNSGMLMARKRKLKQSINILEILSESIMWMIIFIRFNKLKTLLALIVCGGLVYSNVLDKFLMKPWESYSLSAILFIVISGMTSRSLSYIYMATDGVVLKSHNGVSKVSSSLTKRRVSEYQYFESRANWMANKLFFIVSSGLLLLLSYSGLLLPFFLILVGVVNYLFYSYSYEKITIEGKQSKDMPLVKDFGEEVELDDELVDNSIDELKQGNNSGLGKSNGNGGLSKEGILGENWYLKDKPSVIKVDETDEDEE